MVSSQSKRTTSYLVPMGRKVTPIKLSDEQRKELQAEYKRTDSRRYARRCLIILRKADSDQPSNELIASELKVQEVTVAKWVSRYRQKGISGLNSKPIPGRPNIFDPERDAQMVKEQVKCSRQRLELARKEIEKLKGMSMSSQTLRRFLKNLAHDSADYV